MITNKIYGFKASLLHGCLVFFCFFILDYKLDALFKGYIYIYIELYFYLYYFLINKLTQECCCITRNTRQIYFTFLDDIDDC